MTIKREDSDRFYSRISLLAKKGKFPLRAMFELTYKCNFRCIHCYVAADKDREELTTEQVKVILDQLRDAGCFHIGFTGGEPLMRDDILEILDYAKINGFRISLLTNGFLIDKRLARRIASLGTALNRVDISLLGATEDTFEKITKKEGGFNNVIHAIRLLKKEGVNVQIKTTLMKANRDEFLMVKKLAEKFDTMFRYSTTIVPKTNGDKTPLRYQVRPEVAFRLKEKLSAYKWAIDEDIKEGWNHKNIGKKNIFRCGAGQTEVSISPYGEMNLCLEIHYPRFDILESSFNESWRRLKEFVQDFKPPKNYLCKDCTLASFCQWCPARGLLISGGLTRCSKDERQLALVEAIYSPIWDKMAPIWDKQKEERNERHGRFKEES